MNDWRKFLADKPVLITADNGKKAVEAKWSEYWNAYHIDLLHRVLEAKGFMKVPMNDANELNYEVWLDDASEVWITYRIGEGFNIEVRLPDTLGTIAVFSYLHKMKEEDYGS